MIKSVLAVFGAIGYFFAGLTGQVDTSNSKAQVADPVVIEASTTPPVSSSTATSTSTTTPTTTTDPIITSATVDKQTFDKPSTVTVSWVGKNIVATTPISVSVVNASTNAQAIAPTNTAFSVGKKALTIPNTFVDGGYRIVLKATINKQVLTLASVPFTVTSPAIPDAQLSIFAPTLNSSFIKGTAVDVKWDSLNITASSPVVFTLINTSTNQEFSISAPGTIASTKTKKITLPSTALPGTYKFKVSINPVGKSSVVKNSEEFNITDSVDLTASCSKTQFNRNLTLGDTGNDVVALHNFLKLKKIATGNSTGKFEATLRTALISYQTSKGIFPADGVAGPLTRATLNADCLSAGVLPQSITVSVNTGASSSVSVDSDIAVSWTSENIPLSNAVAYKLVNQASKVETLVFSSAQKSTGRVTETIASLRGDVYVPKTLALGQYVLQVETLASDKKTKIVGKSNAFAVVGKTEIAFRDASCKTIMFTKEPTENIPTYEAAALSNFFITRGLSTNEEFRNTYIRNKELHYELYGFATRRGLNPGSYTDISTTTFELINAECRDQVGKGLVFLRPLTYYGSNNYPVNPNNVMSVSWFTEDVPADALADINVIYEYTKQNIASIKGIKLASGVADITIPPSAIPNGSGWNTLLVKVVPKSPSSLSTSSVLSRTISYLGIQSPSSEYDKYRFTSSVSSSTTYTYDDLLTVNWTSTAVIPNQTIKLMLVAPVEGYAYPINRYLSATVPSSNGVYTFKLPKTLPNKKYSIAFVPQSMYQYGDYKIISPEFSFNSTKNSLTQTKVTLNKASIPANLYVGRNNIDDYNILRSNINWTVAANDPSDTMKIYLVPKNSTASSSRYKIWEGPLSAKETPGAYAQNEYIIKSMSLSDLMAKFPAGKYNIVLEPVTANGVDKTSVLVSNDITLAYGGIKITNAIPKTVVQGGNIKIDYAVKDVAPNMLLQLDAITGSHSIYSRALTNKYSPTTFTGTLTIPIPANTPVGKATISFSLYHTGDFLCVPTGCYEKNPTPFSDYRTYETVEVDVVAK